ncbi:MAG: nitroreductase family protein [Paludibacteraceae bacterium]|nr:nitroreductase family protein [Paludibacteraceae bacterium]
MLKFLNNRRTIRKYKELDVDNGLIEKLLEAAGRASTTGNMQLYSVVVTKDEAKKAELAPTHFNQPTFKNAPVVLTFCADYNRFNKWCEENEAVPGYDNFLSFLTAVIDTLLVAQTFCIAAESEGLGICYLGTTTYNADKISDILNLPDYVVPVTTITLGYPDEAPELTDRIKVGGWVHYEEYKDYDSADIKRVFGYKDEMEENKKFIAENGKKTLAQVFTDVRYKKADNEFFSEAFINLLKKKGFLK